IATPLYTLSLHDALPISLEKWEGPYSTEFEGRRSDEMSSRLLVVSDLKEGAKAWALAWKKALDQQNQNNRQQKLEQMKEDRNWRSEEHTSELQSRFDLVC